MWLQVGISATAAVGQALYYEVAQRNKAPRYVMLKGHVPVGVTFHIAVLEDRAHRDSWPGGGWEPLTASSAQSDPGYELTQRPHSLLAASAS